MRTFFLLLLLSNIAFAVFQWQVPFERLLSPAPSRAATERIKLLNEPEIDSAQVSAGSTPQIEGGEGLAGSGQGLCYTLGPFKQDTQMEQAVSEFRAGGIEVNSRSSVEQEYLGMMVYIDSQGTRAQAARAASVLEKNGITDFLIVNEPGKQNALSLGVFGLKKNADRRQRRVSALGFPVKTEPRYRNRTIYWLDYSQQESEYLRELVDGLKNNLGISRISRQCG